MLFRWTKPIVESVLLSRNGYFLLQASKTATGVPKVDESQKRCVHFYACICAFASDDKLHEEFGYYISLDSQGIYTTRAIIFI
jgi:hypothetical protein